MDNRTRPSSTRTDSYRRTTPPSVPANLSQDGTQHQEPASYTPHNLDPIRTMSTLGRAEAPQPAICFPEPADPSTWSSIAFPNRGSGKTSTQHTRPHEGEAHNHELPQFLQGATAMNPWNAPSPDVVWRPRHAETTGPNNNFVDKESLGQIVDHLRATGSGIRQRRRYHAPASDANSAVASSSGSEGEGTSPPRQRADGVTESFLGGPIRSSPTPYFAEHRMMPDAQATGAGRVHVGSVAQGSYYQRTHTNINGLTLTTPGAFGLPSSGSSRGTRSDNTAYIVPPQQAAGPMFAVPDHSGIAFHAPNHDVRVQVRENEIIIERMARQASRQDGPHQANSRRSTRDSQSTVRQENVNDTSRVEPSRSPTHSTASVQDQQPVGTYSRPSSSRQNSTQKRSEHGFVEIISADVNPLMSLQESPLQQPTVQQGSGKDPERGNSLDSYGKYPQSLDDHRDGGGSELSFSPYLQSVSTDTTNPQGTMTPEMLADWRKNFNAGYKKSYKFAGPSRLARLYWKTSKGKFEGWDLRRNPRSSSGIAALKFNGTAAHIHLLHHDLPWKIAVMTKGAWSPSTDPAQQGSNIVMQLYHQLQQRISKDQLASPILSNGDRDRISKAFELRCRTIEGARKDDGFLWVDFLGSRCVLLDLEYQTRSCPDVVMKTTEHRQSTTSAVSRTCTSSTSPEVPRRRATVHS